MQNRFNNLTSKEWLPFQKSWFKFSNRETLYRENVRFFINFKDKKNPPNLFYVGDDAGCEIIKTVAELEKARLFGEADLQQIDQIQFVLVDFLETINASASVKAYHKIKAHLLQTLSFLKDTIAHRKFVVVFIRNVEKGGVYFPFAWDLAKNLQNAFSIKDEKIGCFEAINSLNDSAFFHTNETAFYSLYFRKDENSCLNFEPVDAGYFQNKLQIRSPDFSEQKINSWHILKPKPRNKDEILHPAKFPEELVELFLPAFTKVRDNVFDPMCGTGSALLASLQNNRHGYGVELSGFFSQIAQKRCGYFLNSRGETPHKLTFQISCADARKISFEDFAPFDYIFTSPPYWDMLNMKGAEGQARRKEKGLQLNYSDDTFDLGNISEYEKFLNELVSIYFKLIENLKPTGYVTIVVKNIKKKGKNYPLAYDLSLRLQEKLILLPEVFWLQDDISIAPYGYFNTWVSNTFHHYCLTFQKP